MTFVPFSGAFPPEGPVTVTKTILAYIYTEYNDDDALLSFNDAYNDLTQEYTDWYNDTPLAVYTDDNISGLLLDWVGAGIYNYPRPVLPSGTSRLRGPFNTWAFNSLPFNGRKIITNSNYYATTDDVYKRCLTWHTFVGDGKYFTIRWLKRRVMRWLIGVNGSAPNIDQTYAISVTFSGDIVTINIISGTRFVVGGALFNRFAFNTAAFNQVKTVFNPNGQMFPLAPIFRAAVQSGALELPFQRTFLVSIAT